MGKLYDLLMKDYRLKEGLNACINCGTCTAICPAAEFYRYDPRRIVDIVQSKDEEEIEILHGDYLFVPARIKDNMIKLVRVKKVENKE